ncbi:unnamed protein product [Cylicostephanus goldi]|uniref:Uncharacterized protein n=1 Tax=Cylicostephanus goldi TaxID=71465 RepID=A0A3P7MEG9_CYLGO|nr:unnamed protein product [Cylicostephanus goldi]
MMVFLRVIKFYLSGCDVTKTIGDIYPHLYNGALLCVTDQKNIKDGDEIYKVGTPKAECNPLISDVGPSVASVAEFPGSENEQSTKCVWGEINDTLRMHMLDTHNTRRATLALGQITDNTGATLPAATDMNTLTVTEWWKPVRKVAGPGPNVYFRLEHNSTAIRSFTLVSTLHNKNCPTP